MFEYDGDTTIRTCNKSECREKEKEESSEKATEFAKEFWNTVIGQMNKGEDLDESYINRGDIFGILSAKDKQNFREYQTNIEKLRQEKKELKKLQEKKQIYLRPMWK